MRWSLAGDETRCIIVILNIIIPDSDNRLPMHTRGKLSRKSHDVDIRHIAVKQSFARQKVKCVTDSNNHHKRLRRSIGNQNLPLKQPLSKLPTCDAGSNFPTSGLYVDPCNRPWREAVSYSLEALQLGALHPLAAIRFPSTRNKQSPSRAQIG